MPKRFIPSRWLKRNMDTCRRDPNPRMFLENNARRINANQFRIAMQRQPTTPTVITPTYQIEITQRIELPTTPRIEFQTTPRIELPTTPRIEFQTTPRIEFQRPVVEYVSKIDFLLGKLESTTSCFNIDADYAIELFRNIINLCPLYYFAIPFETIKKVKWEHMQYDDLMEGIKNDALNDCEHWKPTKREEHYALNKLLKDLKEMLVILVEKDYDVLYFDEKELFGIKSLFNFNQMKHEINEVVKSIEYDVDFNDRELNYTIICNWLINSKLLTGKVFRILSLCLALLSKSDVMINESRRKINEIKIEHNESSEETYLSEELSSIHNDEPSFVEDDRNVLSLLDLEANSEELKEFDELLEKQHHKKF